ncbi:Calx-beta domain-containing protein [Pedobacter aquae]|nr:Calx-beta domain-containing protein [Pedobacter aquae]
MLKRRNAHSFNLVSLNQELRDAFFKWISVFFLFWMGMCQFSFAEGSKDLIVTGGGVGHRAFLLSTTTVSNNNPFPTLGTVKVYVRAGEFIYLGSSAQQIGNGRMNVRAPGGATYSSAALAAGVGLITNKNQEDAGPLPNAGGYTPWILPVGVGQEGVWEIDFISPDVTAGQQSGINRTNANAAWTQSSGSPGIAAFDVSVRNSANTAFVTGRAFTNIFVGSIGAFDANFTGKFKILTKDGYQYDVDNNGQSGYVFSFFANNKGFKDALGNPIYRSVNTLTGTIPVQDPRTLDTGTDITHKIFFNTPDASMPATAATPSGSTWLYTTPVSPQAANFLFEGKEGTQNQAGTAPLGANLTFETNQTGSYIIDIDINKNGIFNDAIDRRLTGLAGSGSNTIYWDGLNGLGAKVQGNFTFSPSNLNLSLVGGEVHFPFLDVENNINGIIIRRLNGVNAPNDIVYWNDTGISSNTNPSNPRDASVNGISSAVNGHKWGSNAYNDNAFGNEVGLDTWTYVVSNTVLPFMNVTLKEADLEVISIVPSKTSYCVGENISYVVRVRNNGPDAVSGAKFTFNFPTQFNVSSTTSAVTTGTATITGSATTSGQYSATLDMSNAAVIAFTINGALNNYPGGTLSTSASILRPIDVTDPDATNEDALPPTDPLIECNAGTAGCNNIKEDASVSINVRTISVASAIVAEGTGGTRNLSFPVSLSAVSACDISVDYAIANGTTQASDFAGLTSGTITIPAGSTTTNILIPIATDNIIEANETFTITLANPTGGNTIFMGTATGTINNDDNAQITITKVDGNEENAIPARFIFSFPPGVFADADTEVEYELSGTATGSGPDYPEALTGSVIIPAGQQSATLTLNTVNDDIVEGTETVIIDIVRINSAYSLPLGTNITLNPTVPTLNIFDNDAATLTISNPIVLAEGNSGTTAFNYTVTLSKATSSSFTVNYNTANNIATIADNDYVTSSGTLTFNGTLNEVQNITVLVNGDQKLEANESFNLLLTTLNNNFGGRLTIPSPNTSGNIVNDDAANITITKIDGAEGGQNVRFTFTLDNGKTADQNLLIPYALTGSALANGSDFTGTAVGNIVLPAGQNSVSLTLNVIDDNLVEGTENLTLTTGAIANPYGITVTNSPQTITITDNDNANISISNVTETEGNSGNKIFSFNVTLNNAVKESFSVNYFTTNGTALAGEDYQAVANGTLGFSGTAGEVRTATITVIGDAKIEPNELFTVTLQNLSKNFNNHLAIGNASATGTIVNDDASTIQITSTNGNETGQVAGTFTFGFATGVTVDSPTEISYTLAGSATAAADYTGATSGTIIIPAGQNNVTLSLPVIDDNTIEGLETIILSSSLVNSPYTISVSNSPQTLNILDNDAGTLTLIGPADVTEGADGTSKIVQFQVQLNKATERPFAIDYDTNNLTALSGEDYITENGSLSFSGALNEIRTVSVTLNGDAKIEADELFNLALSNLSENFGGLLTLANTSATAKILNDDSGNINITSTNGVEGGAAAVFTFSLPAGVVADQAITFNYTLGGLALGNGSDYTGALTGTITIPAGSNSVSLNLPVINDAIVEGTESISITTGTVTSPYNIVIANSPQTLNITDNDFATLSIADASITEGDNGTKILSFDVTLNQPTKESFNVSYSTANATATAGEDYLAAVNSTLTFNGTAGEVRTINITLNGDAKIEADETFTLNLSAISNNFGGHLAFADALATGTILNDDQAQLSITASNGNEQGLVPASFTFALPAGITVDKNTSITYTLSGSASNGTDYTGAITNTIVLPANTGSIILTLPVIDDDLVENTETLILTINNIVSDYNITALSLTTNANILDNDAATLQLTGPPSITEGASATTQNVAFTVVLSKATQRPFTINYTTVNGTASATDQDFVPQTNQLSFTGATAGETRTVNVVVNGDAKIEADELFNFIISGLSDDFGGLLTVPQNTVSATILNDDSGDITITAADGAEGGANGYFRFSFPANVTSDQATVINYVLSGTATNADYLTNPSPVTITIPAGQNSAQLNINVVDDAIVEGQETLELNAVAVNSAYGINLTNSTASLNIQDNDIAEILVTAPTAAPEGNVGTSTQTFILRLTAATAQPFSIPYQTVDGSALAGEDFVLKTGTLNFNGLANEQQTVEIVINGDTKVEPNEILNLLLGSLSNNFQNRLSIPVNTSVAAIQNDDSGIIRMVVSNGSEDGVNGKIRFEFLNGATAAQPIVLNYNLAGTALPSGLDADYTANFTSSITIPAGASFAEITLNIINDTRIEDTETVEVLGLALDAAYPGISLDPARPILNITDNDQAELVLAGPPSVLEGNTGFTTLTYTVKLTKATGAGFNINYSTQNQTATSANSDYVASSGTLNFTGLANETKTINVLVNGDIDIEPNETFTLQLSGLDNNFNNRLVLQGSPLAVNILNDDNDNINITKLNGEEGANNGSFTFSLPVGVVASENLTIDYVIDGTALSGADHAATSGTLVLAAGSNAINLPVIITDDLIVEGTETVRITASVRPNSLNISINNPQETITITDNDEATLTITAINQPELNTGSSNMLFTVTLDKQTALPFTLAYASADVNANAGEDYQAVPGGALLSFNGAANETETISIPITGDTKIEANEVFNIILGTLSNNFEGHLTIPANTVNGTIENDDAAVISITKQDAAEGGNNGQFIFSFPTGFTSDKETLINFSLGGTASGAGVDYTANPSATAITIPANASSGTLTLNINDDDLVEFTENVSLTAVSVNSVYSGITLNPVLPVVNITDNDVAQLTLTGSTAVNEGNSGSTEVTYTVTLNKATVSPFRVDYAATGITASTTDQDYLDLAGFIDFFGQAGESKTFKLFIRGDQKIEADETLAINLSAPSINFDNRLTVQGSPLQLRILNDDTGAIAISSENGEEGIKDGLFRFSLPAGITADQDININYLLSGSATTGADFANLPGSITINAGANSVVLPVQMVDDAVVEGTETLSLSATLPLSVYGITLANAAQSLDILDNDRATIAINNVSVQEGNSSTQTLIFTVSLDKATKLPFNIIYNTQNVNATAGEDYVARINNVLNFNGNANETQNIAITYNGDLKIEQDEVFNLVLGAISNTFENRLALDNTASVGKATLLNDDAGTIRVTAVNGSEDGTKGIFRFSFINGVTADAPTVINYTLGGIALAPADYTSLNLNTITIPAGTSSIDTELNIVDDAIVEGNETVSISGVNVSAPYPLTVENTLPTLQIIDNDIALITLNAPLSITEGNLGDVSFADFTITLNKETATAFNINFASADDQAKASDQDYIPLAGVLNFNGTAGEAKTVRISINGDRKIEANEAFNFLISNLSTNFGNRLSFAQTQTSATIINDDNSNITITKEDGEERADGTKPAIFKFNFDTDVTVDQNITIPYTLSGLSIGQGTDYTGAINGNITIPANNNEFILNLPVIDDQEVELTENVILTTGLVASSYPILVNNSGISLAILDNDDATLTLIGPAPMNEGNVGTAPFTFTVSLNKKVSTPFTVTYKTLDGTATITDQDYTLTSGNLSFNGNAGETINFTVDVKGDRKIEANEVFSMLLDSLSENFNNRLTLVNPTVNAVINNDDLGDITLSSLNGKETGAQKGQFIFSLPAGVTVDKPVQINYVLSGSAAAGTDYNNPAAGSVTIPANTNSAILDINVIDDTLLEETETVVLSVNNVMSDYNLQMRSSIDTLSIEDNDISTLTINGPLSITEGNTGTKTLTFEVKLDKAVAANFTVYYRTQDATASVVNNDYQSLTGTLAFAGLANETKTIALTINGDTRVEGTEFFELWLENLSLSYDGRLRISGSPSRGIILDDDNNPLNKTLIITKIDGEEGANNASFSVAFPSGVTLDTDTEIFYTLGGTAIINQDFQTAATGSLIIPAGQNSVTLNLTVTDDAIVEDTETVSLITGNINNSNYQDIVVANSPSTLQIKDNDEATLTLEAAQITEGDNGVTQINFDVVLNRQTSRGFDVSFRTADATATVADQDYIAKAETIAFTGDANERKTITITINGDINIERDEQFNLMLEPLVDNFNNRLSIPIHTVTGTILNDDDAQVSITKTDGTEGGAPVSFIFSLPPNVLTDEPIQIDYQLAGTALAAGVDYRGANTGSITIAPYQNSATLSLPVVDDNLIEEDETISISVSALNTLYSAAITLNPLIPTAIIRDNDEATLSINGPISVNEGNTGTTALTFIISLDKNTGRSFSINYATADGSATVVANDYIPRSGTLNFAGNASESYPVTVLVNGDRNIEQTEDFFVNLLGLTDNFNNRLKVAGSPARGIILDDDNIPANRSIMITALNGSEDGTAVRFRFSFPPQVVSDVATTIPYALTGTATTNDYTGALAGTVTIPAGQNNVLLSLPVVNDEIIEGKETLILTAGAVINNSFNGITVVNSPAQAEIEDNDTGHLSIQNIELNEGNLGTSEAVFTVSLNKQTSLPFTLSFATADATATSADADYVPISAQLNFTGNVNETRNIRVLVNGDRKLEADEILRVALGTLSNTFEGRLTLQNSSATATIKNDDTAVITVTGLNGAEAGQQAARFIFSFPAGVTADIPTVINYTLGGTATAGDTDYRGSVNGVIAIPAGAERAILDLPVIDDDIIEEDETISITINSINSNYNSSISFNPVLPTLRIIDNDVATLRISDAIRINEGNNGTTPFNFTVTLDKATGNNFTLNYATQDGSATNADNDYNAATGVLSFAGTAGEIRTVTVFVNGDLKLEGNENFNFTISGLSNNFNNRLSIPVNSSMATILNDDEGIITISKIDGTEGLQDARFTFSLPPGVNSDQPINITYRLAGTAGSSDYTANPATGSMVIPAGQNSVALPLAVADDLVLEETETVALNNIQIANAYNNLSLAQPVPVVNIFDNDVAKLTITAPAPTLEGNLGQKSFNFNITLDKATDRSFTLDYNTYDISATTANRDYESRTGRVSFAGFAGETKTIAVPVIGDIELENNETFGFKIFDLSTNFAGKMILGNDASATILNDDIGPVANDDRISTLEDTPITFSVTDNDFHADGINTASVNVVSNPQKGRVQMMQSGKAIYTPALNEFGFDSFTYTVRDALGRLSNIATVIITLVAVNDAPIALDDEFYVKKTVL